MIETETIEYQNCFVAFLDILGFSTKVMDSADSNEKLKVLVDSLSICGKFSSRSKKSTKHGVIPMQSRFFSDSIVFFTKEDERYLVQLFFLIRYLQDRLWKMGICLRGAIASGEMFWPEKEAGITVGPALIEAYELESNIAIYPRILISRKLSTYINDRVIEADPFGLNGELKDLIRQDEDGMCFLDLLNINVNRMKNEYLDREDDDIFSICYSDDRGSKHSEILGNVKAIIDENDKSDKPKIIQKNEWLKSYLKKIE